jgi:curved DNA-binding protein CbpA
MDMINAAFNRLGDAYEVLSDDELRQEFDEMAETARMTGVDLAAMFNAFLQRYRQRQANRQQRQADEDAGPSSAYRAAYRAVQASLYTAKVRPAHRPM